MIFEEEGGVTFPTASQWARGLGAGLGLIMMLVGMIYSIRLFSWVSEGVRNPEKVSELIRRWGEGVSGEDMMDIHLGEFGVIPLGELVALMIIGVAMWVLIRIAFMFVTVGSKVIQNSLGEKDAIKNILLYTFGPGQTKRTEDISSKPGS